MLAVLASARVAVAETRVTVRDNVDRDRFALRVTLPLAGAYLAHEDDESIRHGPIIDLAVALMAVSIVDAKIATKKVVKRHRASLVSRVRPDLTFKQGGVRFAVMAKF